MVGDGLPYPVAAPATTSALRSSHSPPGGLSVAPRSLHVGSGVLSLPLLLPLEHGLVTSMPRGFVGGIAVAVSPPACCWVPGRAGGCWRSGS